MINLPKGPGPRLARGFPLFTFLIYLIAAALLPAPARAAYMFASDLDDYLKRIDPITGAATKVGPMGIPGRVKGLSASPGWTTLYGAEAGVEVHQLWTIDILTGAGSPVGPFGYPIRELAYDYFNDVLYGTDYSNLFTICQASGTASLVGPFVAEGEYLNHIWALDFDTATGRLYGVDEWEDRLFWADPSTGAATFLGEWWGTMRPAITDIAFDWQTGLLYGIEVHMDPEYFLRINKETGEATKIGPLDEPIHIMGLAKPIPEPSTLILLGAGLLLGLRRKKGRRPIKDLCPR